MKKITLIKSFSFLLFLFGALHFGYGQTTLSAGEIAITGFNSDNPDEFSFVLLRDVTNTTTINFTDNGWQTSGSFRTGEGILTWTATSDLPCGTEIIITDNSPFSATIGSISDSASFALATAGDQILAYQGADTSPTFIYAINFDGTGWSNATTAATSALPTGLTDGANALNLGEIDNANYNCASVSGQSAILAGVSSSVNWILDNNRLASLGGCTYTCGTCASTVTWNGTTWSATPDLTSEAIINGDYDSSIDGDLSACSLTVNTGFRLTVGNNSFVEVENDVVVDGQLFVESQGNFIQNNDLATFTDNTTNGVRVTKTKNMTYKFGYTYWSSPVVNETMQQVFSTTPVNRRFRFEAANFVDLLEEVGNTGVFLNNPGVDDIDDDGNDWQFMSSGALIPGVGYAVTPSEFGPSFPRFEDFTFFGEFNNGEVLVPLVNNSGGLYNDWNLVGNPYPCAISADTFLTVNSGLVGVIYLWDQATPASSSSGGSQGFNFSADDYAMINGTGELGARGNSGTPPNRFVPSGQGFFVEALNSGDLTFNNSMRSITNDNSQFFKNSNSKKSSTSLANKLWLNLTSDNGVFNQLLVGYVDGATNNNDGDFYDAKRIMSTGNAAILYSTIQNDNGKFAIQGKEISSLNKDEIIKLGFKTNIDVATLYKVSIQQLQGDFLTNNTVYLKDNLLNKVHDLSASDYTFTSDVGEFNSRFEVVFSQASLSTDEFALNSKSLKIVELEDDQVQFTTTEDLSIKNVNIYDLLGRPLYTFKGNSDSEIYTLSNISSSIYIAKVELSNGAVITKKAIKK